jgi:putative ABC transport system permease protein
MQGMEIDCHFRIVGQSDVTEGQKRTGWFSEVSTDFLRTLQVPLRQGRMLDERDNERSPWVAVINDAMVRRYFEGKSPIGKLISVTLSADAGARSVAEDHPRQIVGVIGDMRAFGLDQPPPPAINVPDRQHIREYPGGLASTHLLRILFVRTASSPLRLSETLRRIVAEVDRNQTFLDIRSMDQIISGWLAPWRFYMHLFGIFSVIATCMAIVGIYGVISYSVTRRTHEIGLRLALGATPRNVLLLVIGQGLELTLAGIAVGIAGAFLLTRTIAHLLYEVEAGDPLTLAAVAALLAAVSLIACYVPARRATRVDPVIALRYE